LVDNSTLNPGLGGDSIRDKDRSGVKTQIVGIDMGIGTVTENLMSAGQQTMANSMPVAIASDQAAIPAGLLDSDKNIGKISTDLTTHGESNLVAADITNIGGVTVRPGPQPMSNSLPVSIASDQLPGSDRVVIGMLLSATSPTVEINTQGCGTVGVALQSIGATASITVTSEASVDGVGGWVSLTGVASATGINASSWAMGTQAAPTTFTAACAGYSKVRIRVTAYTSGIAAVTMRASAGSSTVSLATALPIGTNSIGTVILGAGASSIGTAVLAADTALVDNAQFTDGTTKVVNAGFILDEVAGTTALSENDTGAARMDIKRAQVATIEDSVNRGNRVFVTAQGEITTRDLENIRANEMMILLMQAQQAEAQYASGESSCGNYGFEIR
jgi:hypothetical protein